MNTVQTETIRQFTVCATAICSLLEDHCAYSANQFIRELTKLLPDLYKLGLLLPAAESSDVQQADLAPESMQWIYRNAADKLGKVKLYQEIFDPFDFENPSPVTGDLADDLTDIYLALKRGLITLNNNAVENHNAAIGSWKIEFSHWGRHTVDALRALHWIITEDLLSK